VALAKLEKEELKRAREVLNRAIEKVPASFQLWIELSKIEEYHKADL